MSDSSKDPPPEVLPDGGRYVSDVVDLARLFVFVGMTLHDN